MVADRDEEVVEAEPLDPAEAIAGRPLENVLEIRIGVSYLTSEKLLLAEVVIFNYYK